MSAFITDIDFDQRLRKAVSVTWAVFARKVGGGLIPVNREASMQLQFAYVLKQLLPLTLHHPGEAADVELEAGVRIPSGTYNIDILLRGTSPTSTSGVRSCINT